MLPRREEEAEMSVWKIYFSMPPLIGDSTSAYTSAIEVISADWEKHLKHKGPQGNEFQVPNGLLLTLPRATGLQFYDSYANRRQYSVATLQQIRQNKFGTVDAMTIHTMKAVEVVSADEYRGEYKVGLEFKTWQFLMGGAGMSKSVYSKTVDVRTGKPQG
jgi:hypothetical protein